MCDVLNTPFNRGVIIISFRRVIYLFNLIRWHTGTIEKPKTRFAEKQMCDAWNARRFAYKMILSLWVYMLVMIPNNNYPNTLRIIMSLSTRIPKRKNIENTFLKWFIFLFHVVDLFICCAGVQSMLRRCNSYTQRFWQNKKLESLLDLCKSYVLLVKYSAKWCKVL